MSDTIIPSTLLSARHVAGTDATRENIACLYVTPSHVVATNGHALVRLAREPGVEDHDPILMPTALAERAAKATAKTQCAVILSNGGEQCRAQIGDDVLSAPANESLFPDYGAVIPTYEGEQTIRLGINPWLLVQLAKAMGRTGKDGSAIVALTIALPGVDHEGKPRDHVLAPVTMTVGACDGVGVIMPARV